MEALQQFLTIAIEAAAVLGFGGIVLHSMWMNHYRWCADFMPEVIPFDEYVAQAANLIKIEPSPNLIKTEPVNLIKTEPTLNLNKVEPVNLIKTEEVATGLALNKTLDTQQLRELCDRHRIQWRHYKGKGRHMPKAVMASSLATVS